MCLFRHFHSSPFERKAVRWTGTSGEGGALSTRDISMGASRAQLPPPIWQVGGSSAGSTRQQSHRNLACRCVFRTLRLRLFLNLEWHLLPFLFKEFGCGWRRGERAQPLRLLCPSVLRMRKNPLLGRSSACLADLELTVPVHDHRPTTTTPPNAGFLGRKKPLPPRSPTKIYDLTN